MIFPHKFNSKDVAPLVESICGTLFTSDMKMLFKKIISFCYCSIKLGISTDNTLM